MNDYKFTNYVENKSETIKFIKKRKKEKLLHEGKANQQKKMKNLNRNNGFECLKFQGCPLKCLHLKQTNKKPNQLTPLDYKCFLVQGARNPLIYEKYF